VPHLITGLNGPCFNLRHAALSALASILPPS